MENIYRANQNMADQDRENWNTQNWNTPNRNMTNRNMVNQNAAERNMAEHRTAGRERIIRRRMARIGFNYLFVSLFVMLFGAIYEYFSFGVYSNFMLYAFAFPLVGGALVYFGLAYRGKRFPDTVTCRLHACAIATWTVGSLMQGILDIYGTTNALIRIYWIAGAVLLVAALIRYGLSKSDR